MSLLMPLLPGLEPFNLSGLVSDIPPAANKNLAVNKYVPRVYNNYYDDYYINKIERDVFILVCIILFWSGFDHFSDTGLLPFKYYERRHSGEDEARHPVF